MRGDSRAVPGGQREASECERNIDRRGSPAGGVNFLAHCDLISCSGLLFTLTDFLSQSIMPYKKINSWKGSFKSESNPFVF